MSRLKRYAHSLFSGYIMLGTNAVYTLASVRLAMHYLPTNKEFGLWALTSSIIGYVNLVDLGLSGSASRILVDYKDQRASGEYGSVVQTTALVGLAQGAIVFLAGLLIALIIGPLLKVPVEFQGKFFWLLAGQSVVTAITMITRVFSLVLSAHQRYDIMNHAGSLSFVVNFGAMWACFASGCGVLSLLAGQFTGLLLTIAIGAWSCRHLGILPGRGQWGRPTWEKFRELFSFAQDIFLYTIGTQLVGTSQAMLLSPLVGLDAVAAWSVNTRAYLMLTQIIYRIFDFSSAALAEMIVRGEQERLKQRFRQIVELSMSLAVAAAVLFALGNSLLAFFLSHGRIHWPPVNDLLLGLWLLLCVSVHAHTGLVGQSKVFRFMRFIFLIEGGVFIGLMFLLHSLGALAPEVPAGAPRRFDAITIMLLLSIGCTLACTFSYGLYRTRDYFGMTWRELAGWHQRSLRLAAMLLPVAVVAGWTMQHASRPLQLAVILPATALWALFALLRFGLPDSLHEALANRLPFLRKVIGAPA